MKVKICNLVSIDARGTHMLEIVIEKEELSLLYLCSKVFPPVASRATRERDQVSRRSFRSSFHLCSRVTKHGSGKERVGRKLRQERQERHRVVVDATRDSVVAVHVLILRRRRDKNHATWTDIKIAWMVKSICRPRDGGKRKEDSFVVVSPERGGSSPSRFEFPPAESNRIKLLRLRSLASLWSPMLRRLLRLKVVSSSAASIVRRDHADPRERRRSIFNVEEERRGIYFNYRDDRRRDFVVILSVMLCDLVVFKLLTNCGRLRVKIEKIER